MTCKSCGGKGYFRVLNDNGVDWDDRTCDCRRKTHIAATALAEGMARGWELMQEGLKLPGKSTALFVRGENALRAAVAAYRKQHPAVKTTRCLLCKTRVRCVAVSEANDAPDGTRTITTKLFHDQGAPGELRLCRDPAARGHKPSRPRRSRSR